jgi:hypothetical protein
MMAQMARPRRPGRKNEKLDLSAAGAAPEKHILGRRARTGRAFDSRDTIMIFGEPVPPFGIPQHRRLLRGILHRVRSYRAIERLGSTGYRRQVRIHGHPSQGYEDLVSNPSSAIARVPASRHLSDAALRENPVVRSEIMNRFILIFVVLGLGISVCMAGSASAHNWDLIR